MFTCCREEGYMDKKRQHSVLTAMSIRENINHHERRLQTIYVESERRQLQRTIDLLKELDDE